jgi:hypothetical protein
MIHPYRKINIDSIEGDGHLMPACAYASAFHVLLKFYCEVLTEESVSPLRAVPIKGTLGRPTPNLR